MTSQIKIEHKPWETKYFGLDVYGLYLDIDGGEYEKRFSDTRALVNNIRTENPRYEFCLINSDEVPVIAALENIGFKYLVATVELDANIYPGIEVQYIKYPSISKVNPGEVSILKDIAHTSFTTGRLHAEYPRVDMNAMHSEWIENCCKGTQAEEVFVSHDIDGVPTGFIAVKHSGTVGDIVLIAIDKKYRRFGFGSMLLIEAMRWANELNLNKMIVRTELTNIAAVRLYECGGFRFTGGGIYLGRWVE
jgi:dTDP-4-amino-4,6-dideoxy-D-galactose acyltransferase